MKIEGHCATSCIDEGEPTQLAGCGIILSYIDFAGRRKSRQFGFALGGSDSELASIQSVRLALSSIIPAHRHYSSIIWVDNSSVVDILNGADTKYVEAAKVLKRWFGFYADLKVVYDTVRSDRASEIALMVAENQEHYDSGSLDVSI